MPGIPNHQMIPPKYSLPADYASTLGSSVMAAGLNYTSSASILVFNALASLNTITLPTYSGQLPQYTKTDLTNAFIQVPMLDIPPLSIGTFVKPDFSQIWVYSSDFLVAMQNWITTELTQGSLGYSPATQDAMFMTGIERSTQELSEKKHKAEDTWAKSNWGKPDSILLNMVAQLEKTFMEQRYTLSKSIRLDSEKVVLERMKTALDSAVKLEETLIMYAPQMMQAISQAYGALANAFKVEVKAILDLIDAFIKKYKAQLEGRIAQAKLSVIENDMLISYNDAQFSRDASLVEIAIKEFDLALNVAVSSQHIDNARIAGIIGVGAQLFAGAIASCHAQAHLGYAYHQSTRQASIQSTSNNTRWVEYITENA